MLRSIFSLIQNIIDSDKDYKNKKSNTVIYLMSNSDNPMNMDLEIDGKGRETLKSIGNKDSTDSGTFKITTEQGDTVICRHSTEKNIRLKSANEEKLHEEYNEQVTKISERASFVNEEKVEETYEESSKFDESAGDKRMNVHELLTQLPQSEIKSLREDRDELNALLEQIQKMKKGMERLQEIAQQFKCSEKFKQDVEFLMKNVTPALDKGEAKQTNLSTKES